MERAISIRQPWAWAIAAGLKDVENRSWRTSYRGPLLIHAGLTIDQDGLDELARRGVTPRLDQLERGALIARVRLVDVVTDSPSSWADAGSFHFVLADVEPLAEPIPCRGMVGLFRPPGRLASQ